MATKRKASTKKATKHEKWSTVQVVNSANELPVFIQALSEGEKPVFRGVYLVDTKLKQLEFYSADRGEFVTRSSDANLIVRAAVTKTIEFTKDKPVADEAAGEEEGDKE